MRTLAVLALFFAAGCEPMQPSGAPLSPVAIEEPEAPPAPEPEPAFDFEEEEPPEPEVDEDPDPEELARAMGIDPDALEAPEDIEVPLEEPEPEPEDVAEAEVLPDAPPPLAEPDGTWGVRLLSTLPDTQPPRAVLGLPDGTEAVVEPGTLLPEARLVVLAVGRDGVHVAEVIPRGDHARIESQTLQPMYRQERAGR